MYGQGHLNILLGPDGAGGRAGDGEREGTGDGVWEEDGGGDGDGDMLGRTVIVTVPAVFSPAANRCPA